MNPLTGDDTYHKMWRALDELGAPEGDGDGHGPVDDGIDSNYPWISGVHYDIAEWITTYATVISVMMDKIRPRIIESIMTPSPFLKYFRDTQR